MKANNNKPVSRRVFQEIPTREHGHTVGCPFDQVYATVGDPCCEDCPFYLGRAENNNVLCTHVDMEDTGYKKPVPANSMHAQIIFIEAWRKYGLNFDKINEELNKHGYFIKREDFDKFEAEQKETFRKNNYWICTQYPAGSLFNLAGYAL